MVPGIEELIVGIAAMDRDEAFKLLKLVFYTTIVSL